MRADYFFVPPAGFFASVPLFFGSVPVLPVLGAAVVVSVPALGATLPVLVLVPVPVALVPVALVPVVDVPDGSVPERFDPAAAGEVLDPEGFVMPVDDPPIGAEGDVAFVPGVSLVEPFVTVPDVGVVCVSGVFDSLPPPQARAVIATALRIR